MLNKVVVVYRNDEVARAAANELLEDGFSRDQIYISTDDDVRQVRDYHRIGEDTLLQDTRGSLGDFYRSVIGVDGMLENAAAYTDALQNGRVIVSVDTDSEDKAREAAKTMNHFETVGFDELTGFSDLATSQEKKTGTPYEVAGTGVLIFKNLQSQGNQMDTNNTQTSSSDFNRKVNQKAESAKDSMESAAHTTKNKMEDAADATYNAMEKAVDKTSDALKKAGDSVKEMFTGDHKDKNASSAHTAADTSLHRTTTDASSVNTAAEASAAAAAADASSTRPATGSSTAHTTTASSSTSDNNYGEEAFKKHWKISYWTSGGKYEDCQPAYQYGAQLAENEKKHLNRKWEEVEPSAKAAWELYNRDSEKSWDYNKAAIKFGWDYVMEGHNPQTSVF